jgi:AcrR family transcriptional regulator
MRAALSLVAARGTSNVAISEIAEAADVSRQLVYQQFGDRETLLLEAALDLARRELVPLVTGIPGPIDDRAAGVAAVRHSAQHRPFYRAMLTGPCAYRLTVALSRLLAPFNQPLVRGMSAAEPAPDPLDPEAFADRLTGMVSAITDAVRDADQRKGRRSPRPPGSPVSV